jgi:hypothetical protein
MPYSYDAWDTVIRELQATRDKLAATRDSLGGIPAGNFDRMQDIRRTIDRLRIEWLYTDTLTGAEHSRWQA